MSWDITPLYFFSWNFIYFQQKKAIKVQISWYLTWAVKSLKYCTLMDSFCPNHITFQLKKVPKIYLSWHLRDVKFKEKLTCGLKFEMWFHIFMTWKTSWIFSQTLKILKISLWNCENINLKCALFVQSIWGLSYKNKEGFIFHGTEYWCKIWINANIEVSKMVWRIGWTFMRALKGLKNCTLKGSFCQKHKMFQLVKFRGIMCRDTEGW